MDKIGPQSIKDLGFDNNKKNISNKGNINNINDLNINQELENMNQNN
jgi:hypothetical protein